MKAISLIASVALGTLVLAGPAAAQGYYGNGYSSGARNTACERQKRDDKVTGAIVGALVGGLAGGALGNEIRDNDTDDRRGYRGYRDYDRYGYGYGRRDRRDSGDGDGTVVVGALLGALAGGVAGNALAEGTGPDCQVASGNSHSSYPQGSIPARTDGLYGGPEVMNGGREYPNDRTRSYPVSGASYPTSSYPEYPSYPETRERSRGDVGDCRTVYRETRMPNGRVERDPVTACQDYNGDWRIEGESRARSSEELFG